MCKAKIHRATVTQADLNYIGSITIDQAMLDVTGILPYEMVQITNLSTGTLWHTYVIPGPHGQGDICLNGPPARHFQPGDKVVILSIGQFTEEELNQFQPVVVFVDEKNQITEIKKEEPAFTIG